MKIISRILSLLVITSLGLFYTGCGGGDDDGDSVEKVQFEKLAKTWTLVSASDGTSDRTSEFVNFTLTLSGTYSEGGIYTYDAKGTVPNPNPWPTNGTWKFSAPATSQITRDPNTDSQIELTYGLNGTLTISFTLPEGAPGWAGGPLTRTEKVSGNWVFVFN